jgi:hypothetical protein
MTATGLGATAEIPNPYTPQVLGSNVLHSPSGPKSPAPRLVLHGPMIFPLLKVRVVEKQKFGASRDSGCLTPRTTTDRLQKTRDANNRGV